MRKLAIVLMAISVVVVSGSSALGNHRPGHNPSPPCTGNPDQNKHCISYPPTISSFTSPVQQNDDATTAGSAGITVGMLTVLVAVAAAVLLVLRRRWSGWTRQPQRYSGFGSS